MSPDEDPPKNPFVRWKQHVDRHIADGLNSVLGVPSIISKTLQLNSTGTSPQSTTPTTDPSVSDQVQQLRRIDCPRVHEPKNMRSFTFNIAAQAALGDIAATIHDPDYSPLCLDQHLPPPVPRGVPDDVELDPHTDFTYRDAYEDLLRVSTGLPLTPFSTLAARKSPGYRMYGFDGGETPFSWLGRISSQGLIHRVLKQAAQQPYVVEEDGQRDQKERQDTFAALTKSWSETNNPFRSDPGDTFGRDTPNDKEQEEDEFPRSLFTELNRAFRVMERVFDEAAEKQTRRPDSKDQTQEKLSTMPSTEAEMYEMLRQVMSGDSSLSSLVRAAMGISAEAQAQTTSSWTSQSTSARGDDDTTGTRTVRTTEEHTDEDGNRHRKVTVQKLNAAGEEISRETHHTTQSGSKSRGRPEQDGETNGRKAPSPSAEREPVKSSNVSSGSGWFWK